METLANLEAFLRSAEHGSFSEAARRLSLTPAAVSRNVAVLERNLGVRLFTRSTRRLTLTEAGESFRLAIGDKVDGLKAAIADAADDAGEPAGRLRVSLAPNFGVEHIVPLLPEFLARYPRIQPEWRFEGRPVDLYAEGYDAAIGGALELSPAVVARTLAPAHIVAVAAPTYLDACRAPADPSGLADLDGIVMHRRGDGRPRHWTMRDAGGHEMRGPTRERIIVDDPAAARAAARLGLGVAMLAVPDAIADLEEGRLVRLLPEWWAEAGTISIYYASRKLLPAKTRAFVDWIAEAFRTRRLAQRFSGVPPRRR